MNRRKFFLKLASFISISLGILLTFSWMSDNTVDCYYTTEIFLQMRFCDNDWDEKMAQEPDLIKIIVAAILIIVGGVSWRLSKKY